MYFENNSYYNDIFIDSEKENPYALFDLAMAYGSGQLIDSNDSKYIFYLKRFFESELIKKILLDLDSENDELSTIEFHVEYTLFPLIIEAGISLGLYYKNSSIIDELALAQECLYNALIASKFDFIEVELGTDDESTDILSILADISDRIRKIEGGESDD